LGPPYDPTASKPERQLEFVGTSKDDLSSFPQEVKLVTGYALRQIQNGKQHPDAKPMKGNLREVIEISAHDDSGNRTYRTTCAIIGEAVYVLHAFQKKSTSGFRTPRHELDLIKNRLKAARTHWKEQHGKDPR
jgi:phage-related protein